MAKLTEIEILRKLATCLDKSIQYKSKYDEVMSNYYKLVDDRYDKKNIQKRTKVVQPLYSKYKDNKAQAEGYLFMWKQSKELGL